MAAAVVVVDQAVKVAVLEVLTPGRFVPLLGDAVGWQLVFNPGAAFGIPLPAPVFPVATVVVLVAVLRSLGETGRAGVVAQALVVGGALGNLADRVVRATPGDPLGGLVVDYVAWGSFPRFNVADAAITVGVVLLLVLLLLEERRERARQPA
ncbi:MAG: signal peptidase II [Nitriliruptoraceae bacterium]